MNLAMAGVMHPKTLCIRHLELAKLQSWDWMTIIVSAYQR